MAQPYLDQLEELIHAIDPNSHNLVCKHFFSGAALYVGKKICASLTPKGFAFKLPETRCEDLISKGCAIPLRYFESSPIKRGYILIPDIRDLGNMQIAGYVDECISYVASTDA